MWVAIVGSPIKCVADATTWSAVALYVIDSATCAVTAVPSSAMAVTASASPVSARPGVVVVVSPAVIRVPSPAT